MYLGDKGNQRVEKPRGKIKAAAMSPSSCLQLLTHHLESPLPEHFSARSLTCSFASCDSQKCLPQRPPVKNADSWANPRNVGWSSGVPIGNRSCWAFLRTMEACKPLLQKVLSVFLSKGSHSITDSVTKKGKDTPYAWLLIPTPL